MAGRIAIALLFLVSLPENTALAAGPVCGSNTPLTLIGIDTTTGTMLLSAPPLGPAGPWVVELSGDGSRARLHPDRTKGRFGGSVGPGPVIAAAPCGKSCVQPVRWTGGEWEPLGDPLLLPAAVNVMPTYDRTGAAWFLVQSPAAQDGTVRVQAFRLENRDWKDRGTLNVTSMGQPPALPAPQRKDGVLAGTGLFSASGRPETWVSGVPSLPPARRGQLIALTGTSAAYLSADGVVYLSDDSGKKWRRDTWTPWGGKTSEVVGSWRQGSDYWVDISFGNQEGGLRLVWYDRRIPTAGERILLTRLTPGGGWATLAEAPSEIRTNSGDVLPIAQVLTPKGSTWILLSACVNTAQGSGLVLRVYDGAKLSDPRFLPFTRP